jgi:serine/threonine protein kinase
VKDLAKIEEICYAALARPLEEREIFLQEVCGNDPELRREVESLLLFEEQAKDFIETPPQDIAAAIFTKQTRKNLLGTKLNHYKILSALGAGGMGEVYLAEDKKLGRKIALKLLPSQFSQDAERISRFEREARAVSALNHPNIITIYAIEEAENFNFIATELVDGETLREKIAETPFDPQEAIEIGIQVAGALESAHAVGIIHRDIKPANIMIRRDGLVKVLDFGLAKLMEDSHGEMETWRDEGEIGFIPASSPQLPNSPAPSRQTNFGAIMGTLNYMSPEQARGEKLDARTDIFSLGVVLYEMLSGVQPFAGASEEDIYEATINKTPTPVRRLNSEIPFELDQIISRALTKDRSQRYQSMSALRLDLRKLKQHSTAAGERFPALPAPFKTTTFGWILPLTALLLLVLSVAWYFSLSPTVPQVTPFQTIKLDRLTAQGLTVTNAISPDGQYVVYAKKADGKQSLWQRQIATLTDSQIVPPGQMNYVFLNFSPDGESVYFVGTESVGAVPSLFQISTNGSNQRKLIEGVNSQISFSPDGKSLAFVRDKVGEDNLIIAEARGENERVLAVRKNPEIYTEGISWSPDGKLIASSTLKRQTAYGGGVAVVEVATGIEKPVALSEKVIRVSHLAWLKDGSGLIFCRFASPTGKRYQLQYLAFPSGKIQKITNDLSSYEDLSLTGDGKTIVSTQREYSMGIWLTKEGDFTKAAQIETKTGRDDGERGISWTKDGKIIYVSSEGDAQNLWRMDVDGSNQKPLTGGSEYGKLYPTLNHDNGLITFIAQWANGHDYFQMDSEGQNTRRVTNAGFTDFTASSNKDWIVHFANADGKKRIWKTAAGGGKPIKLTDVESNFPALSPDGKFVAYLEMETGQPQKIAVISIDGGNPLKSFELPITCKPEAGISWSKEGDAILFVNTPDTTSNIWKQPLDGKPAKPLTDFKEFQIASFALNQEGNRLAVSRGSRNRDSVLVSSIP